MLFSLFKLAEIEHLQLCLEKIRKELQRDFEAWWLNSVAGSDAAPAIGAPAVSQSLDYSKNASLPQVAAANNSNVFQTSSIPSNSKKESVLPENPRVDDEITRFYRLKAAATTLTNVNK